MYITERNGKYRAWKRIVRPDGTVKKISVTIEKNTAQARHKAEEILTEKARKLCPSDAVTFSELCRLYLADSALRLKKSTLRKNKIILDVVSRELGGLKLSDLTAGRIKAGMLRITTKPSTLNSYRLVLKALIRWAYQNDYISSTACTDKLAVWDEKKEKKQKYLEKAELQEVIAAADPFRAALIEFLALSGLRVGEMIALDREDVADTEITVSKTYDSIHHIITPPKTASSVRKVFVQPELLKVIRKIRKMSDQHRLISGSRADSFIVDAYGHRLPYQMFTRYIGRITEQVTGRRLTAHSLRHTHTSLLAEAGIPLETISRRLGHNRSAVTKEVYLHVTSKMEERDREMLKKVSIL